ncbi:penicillin acylase family protein [Ensifer sp. MJa1]|uniref:penicillin acylase family protein n=1 Tax=Ensifer sp. MJa1 TaxID=2919888 RepID=UPI00300B1BF0
MLQTRRPALAALLFSAALAPVAPGAAHAGSKVEIIRDNWGVPHVYADDTYGLYAGFGYAVATDRLFQMEMSKHSVLGTVSSVLGADHLGYDIATRADFDHADIRAQIEALPKEERDILRGYAAGYNRRVAEVLADRGRLLPKQFADFGIEPTTWSDFDVAMIYVVTMAGRFSHYSTELDNAKVLATLEKQHGRQKAAELFDQMFWLEDPLAPTTVPKGGQFQIKAENKPLRDSGRFDALIGRPVPGGDEARPRASNLWILGPKKTTDGSTMLMNGPQFGNFNPSYVYSIGLHGAGFDLTGSTPFAVPNVLFGTNGQIAWGATAGPLDVNDYFQLELNPDNAAQYRKNDVWHDMHARPETFKVKGQPDVTTVVYESDYGVVSQIDPQNHTAYAFNRTWKGKEIHTLLAWVNSTKAQSYEDWLKQAKNVATTINWYYADRQGNIGYVSPGYLPVRNPAQDQRVPAKGDGSMDWQGFRAFADAPKTYNPEQGWIANWNNRSAHGEVANFEATPWGAADRVDEIVALIKAKDKLSRKDVWDINKNIAFLDINARALLPFLLAAASKLAADDPRQALVRELNDWDGRMVRGEDGRATAPAVALFQRWVKIMVEDVLMDDQPGIDPTVALNRISRPTQVLRNALLGDKAGIAQRHDFFNGADKDEVILAALSKAVAGLTRDYGTDQLANWRATLPRHVFATKNYLGIAQAGEDEGTEVGTSMNRGTQSDLITFKDNTASVCMVTPPGQSGFISPSGEKSPHYDDQLKLYESFTCRPQPLTRSEVEKVAVDRLELTVD